MAEDEEVVEEVELMEGEELVEVEENDEEVGRTYPPFDSAC